VKGYELWGNARAHMHARGDCVANIKAKCPLCHWRRALFVLSTRQRQSTLLVAGTWSGYRADNCISVVAEHCNTAVPLGRQTSFTLSANREKVNYTDSGLRMGWTTGIFRWHSTPLPWKIKY